ncbi:glycosyltransferase [Bifidobacterium aquikefiri]|uniref:Glycosyltransferase, group 2 family protein n=1 Tax=Bifidobacterium aquikefiri TaxID=1653207 RepID=A0A261G821_9BIFI|nr:glycosyltransferase [Bifidobacterium aquikefiri]OZG67558.1 glycosyltransferase, group 2 family protein [Bifidobacterium aquikefiri]
MPSKPLVSVIVPVYNIPNDLLSRCFNALAVQTYTNMEIIVIDDGSTIEGNKTICDAFQSNHSQFSVVHKNNEGVSTARNIGIEKSKGKWVTFIDSDDWIEPDYIEKLISFTNTNKMADIVFCDCTVEYENRSVKNSFVPHNFKRFLNSKHDRQLLLLEMLGQNKFYNPPEIGIGVPWGKLYRRNFLKDNNIVFERNLRRMQDNVFNLYAFKLAKSIVYVPQYLYHYNNLEMSVSHRFNTRIIEDFDKVHDSTAQFLKKFPFDNALERGYRSRVVQSLHPILRSYFFHKDYSNNYSTRYQEIRKLISKEPYKTALEHLPVSSLPPKMLVFSLLLKLHLLLIMQMIISKENN